MIICELVWPSNLCFSAILTPFAMTRITRTMSARNSEVNCRESITLSRDRRVVQQQILDANGWKDKKAWAFGLGLERLAMVKFAINDIRTFWSEDERFTKQFKRGNLDTKFKPYSKYPPCFKVSRSMKKSLSVY